MKKLPTLLFNITLLLGATTIATASTTFDDVTVGTTSVSAPAVSTITLDNTTCTTTPFAVSLTTCTPEQEAEAKANATALFSHIADLKQLGETDECAATTQLEALELTYKPELRTLASTVFAALQSGQTLTAETVGQILDSKSPALVSILLKDFAHRTADEQNLIINSLSGCAAMHALTERSVTDAAQVSALYERITQSHVSAPNYWLLDTRYADLTVDQQNRAVSHLSGHDAGNLGAWDGLSFTYSTKFNDHQRMWIRVTHVAQTSNMQETPFARSYKHYVTAFFDGLKNMAQSIKAQ